MVVFEESCTSLPAFAEMGLSSLHATDMTGHAAVCSQPIIPNTHNISGTYALAAIQYPSRTYILSSEQGEGYDDDLLLLTATEKFLRHKREI